MGYTTPSPRVAIPLPTTPFQLHAISKVVSQDNCTVLSHIAELPPWTLTQHSKTEFTNWLETTMEKVISEQSNESRSCLVWEISSCRRDCMRTEVDDQPTATYCMKFLIINYELLLLHIIAVLLNRILPINFIKRKWATICITSVLFVESLLKFND